MNTRTAFAAAAMLTLAAIFAKAAHPALAEPKLTEQSPQFGDVLEKLPDSLHLCFSEVVKVENSTDWKFDVKTPDGTALGLRIVFKPAGDCVDVFVGAPDSPPEGIWTFEWLVHAQSDNSEGSGAVKFQLGQLQPGETPLEKPAPTAGPSSSSGGDSGTPVGLIVAVGVGVALIVVAGGGFTLSRRRRSSPSGR